MLSAQGAFGVDPGEKGKTEVGAFLKAILKKDLTPALNLQTSLDLFSNYLDHPDNIDLVDDELMTLEHAASKTFSLDGETPERIVVSRLGLEALHVGSVAVEQELRNLAGTMFTSPANQWA